MNVFGDYRTDFTPPKAPDNSHLAEIALSEPRKTMLKECFAGLRPRPRWSPRLVRVQIACGRHNRNAPQAVTNDSTPGCSVTVGLSRGLSRGHELPLVTITQRLG